MVSDKVRVTDETGLHLRPAGILCQMACKYQCKIEIVTPKGKANAKSILSVLGACVRCDDEIEIVCAGEDEERALTEIKEAIERGLGKDFKME